MPRTVSSLCVLAVVSGVLARPVSGATLRVPTPEFATIQQASDGVLVTDSS